jgi:hypothetical protein
MGIRTRIKGLVKRAVGRDDCGPCETPKQAVAPPSEAPQTAETASRGNLSEGKDVPWYLKYGDADGWESTNAEDGVDED